MRNLKALAKFVQMFDAKLSFNAASKTVNFSGVGETINTLPVDLDFLQEVATDLQALPACISEVSSKIDEFNSALAGTLAGA